MSPHEQPHNPSFPRIRLYAVILSGGVADLDSPLQPVVMDISRIESAMYGLGDKFKKLRDVMTSTALPLQTLDCQEATEYFRGLERRKIRERKFWGHGKRKASKSIPHW